MKKLFLFISITLLLTTKSNAQRSFLVKHEVGGNIGVSNSQTDFSGKGGNTAIHGFALEATHYLHFLPRRYDASLFYKHGMLKSSLGINVSNFDNSAFGTEGQPLSPTGNTHNAILLGRLKSKSFIISIDNEFQVYFRDIIKSLHKYNKYNPKRIINPYVGLGFGINYINATPTYTPEQLPDNYTYSTAVKTSTVVISGNFTLGARYNVKSNYDIVAELGAKYFFSDWVDGVNPDPDINDNVSNDINSDFSIGIIYHMF